MVVVVGYGSTRRGCVLCPLHACLPLLPLQCLTHRIANLFVLQITDLRSQQVRDVCVFLSTLSAVIGDRIRPLMRDVFSNILDGSKVSNKVMSGYVDECIITLIRNAIFKTAIPTLLLVVRDNKAKMVRERCLVRPSPSSFADF